MRSRSDNRFNQSRRLKDRTAQWVISLGGVGVILAVVLIFFYLLWVVIPVFQSAEIVAQKPLKTSLSQTVLIRLDEQFELQGNLQADGRLVFLQLNDGQELNGPELSRVKLPLKAGQQVVAAATDPTGSDLIVAALSDGSYLLFKLEYQAKFDSAGQRSIHPQVSYPFGEESAELSGDVPLLSITMTSSEDKLVIAGIGSDSRLYLNQAELSENMLSEELELDSSLSQLDLPKLGAAAAAISGNQRRLYFPGADGSIHILDLGSLQWLQSLKVSKQPLTAIKMLLGGISVLAGDQDGRIFQSFPVRNQAGQRELEFIREFPSLQGRISTFLPEARRKGFVVISATGDGGLYYSTSKRKLASFAAPKPLVAAALAPRANGLVLLGADRQLYTRRIKNEHPEFSLATLWQKVWYEGYDRPELVWQSSASNDDFEPKFSLTPLTFGTLKAAFYAMIFAVPLALLGALYTAYFMTPAMRQLVKPTIEIMEALPTVVLGFLAGLWFAPWLELHLMGVFTVVLLLPVGILLFAWLFHQFQQWVKARGIHFPTGWQAAIMIPGVVLVVLALLSLAGPLEQAFFSGDLRYWFKQEWDIGYDQRNAMVVGFAMGFAVIPTIFSMAEDALFSVPKGLTAGSLALGGTPWQTAIRVVLPTASPGIFSALMIGLGRAVGETMIVLMATGNTPLMDFNLFEGMRSLSANIAVELPEAAVNSSHYRILFIAALVLFMFTFVVNTVAEIVRQRLREKYSAL